MARNDRKRLPVASVLKKGRASAGVARQYPGALGGVFPCQIGVMAAWATSAGQALAGRELYLPREWTGDRERCRAAHIPDTAGFATRPRLAEAMIARILPDLPAGRVWVAADEVCGRDGAFRLIRGGGDSPAEVARQCLKTHLMKPFDVSMTIGPTPASSARPDRR